MGVFTSRGRENRFERESKLEATFNITQGLNFDLSIARAFNKQFAEDFNLIPCKINVEHFRGSNLIGQHRRGDKLIRINERLNDTQRWETFFHEIAHYRMRGHSKAFHEEMEMVYRRFVLWFDTMTNPIKKYA